MQEQQGCGGLEVSFASPIVGLALIVYIYTNNINIAKEAGSAPNDSSQAAFIKRV